MMWRSTFWRWDYPDPAILKYVQVPEHVQKSEETVSVFLELCLLTPNSPFLPAHSPAAPFQPVWCNLLIWQRPLTRAASRLTFNASSTSKTGNKWPRESISSNLSVSPNICNSLTKGLKLHPLPFGENGARRCKSTMELSLSISFSNVHLAGNNLEQNREVLTYLLHVRQRI